MTTPAVEVRSFAATIPAGTPLATPATIGIPFPPRLVTAVRWTVPRGPAGLMGWRLTMSGGVAVIPTGGGWIITDGDSDTWPLTGQPDSGAWEVTGYNTDIYPHTVYLQFMLDLVTTAAAPPDLVANAALSSIPPLTAAAVPDQLQATAPVITVPDLAALLGLGG